MRTTIKGELVAKDIGMYSTYVFKNLDEQQSSWYRYVMVTKLPNWDITDINIGDIGFLEYEVVEAGDKYFDRLTGDSNVYKYTNCYLINYIKDNKVKDNVKEFNF